MLKLGRYQPQKIQSSHLKVFYTFVCKKVPGKITDMYGKSKASLWKNLSTGTAQKSFGAIFCFCDFSLQLIFFSVQPFNRNYSTVDSHTNTVISHAVTYSSRWRRKPWQSLLSCRFLFSKGNSYPSFKIQFINRLLPRLKNQL